MARYTGPRLKIIRRLGTPIPGLMRTDPDLRRPYPPGQHGPTKRKKLSDYALRLMEKQKLRFHYSMMEKQFRRFLTIAKKSKGNTGNTLIQLLETRLDNVLRRMGVGRTIWACRQIVAHGHVLVDGRKTDIPSYNVKAGQTITFKEGIHKVLRDNMEQNAGHNVPNWLEFNPAQLTARVNALPTPEDVPFEVNMNLIIEFYR
jgi:small subunit ribosomal protein S4